MLLVRIQFTRVKSAARILFLSTREYQMEHVMQTFLQK